jgi:muramoyltetrapeptide carboxypeptidase
VIRPRRLRTGDRVALVAPASAFKPADLDRGIAELRRLGFEVVYDEAILARERFEAGPAALRARLLHEAWRNPDVSALLCVRGGYGSQQLLPLLDPDVMRAAGKLIIGYSDITALHAWAWSCGVVSLCGPMIDGRLAAGPDAYDERTFIAAVTGTDPLGALTPDGIEVLWPGEAEGPIVGGTLTQLVSLLGTPWSWDVPRGAILLIEDVGERPYRVHRMLTQLAQAGILGRAGAVVFGEFPGCTEPTAEIRLRDVVRDFTRGFPGPVLFGFPFGHTTGPMWSIPIGVQGRVRVDPPSLIVDEPAVA